MIKKLFLLTYFYGTSNGQMYIAFKEDWQEYQNLNKEGRVVGERLAACKNFAGKYRNYIKASNFYKEIFQEYTDQRNVIKQAIYFDYIHEWLTHYSEDSLSTRYKFLKTLKELTKTSYQEQIRKSDEIDNLNDRKDYLNILLTLVDSTYKQFSINNITFSAEIKKLQAE